MDKNKINWKIIILFDAVKDNCYQSVDRPHYANSDLVASRREASIILQKKCKKIWKKLQGKKKIKSLTKNMLANHTKFIF